MLDFGGFLEYLLSTFRRRKFRRWKDCEILFGSTTARGDALKVDTRVISPGRVLHTCHVVGKYERSLIIIVYIYIYII